MNGLIFGLLLAMEVLCSCGGRQPVTQISEERSSDQDFVVGGEPVSDPEPVTKPGVEIVPAKTPPEKQPVPVADTFDLTALNLNVSCVQSEAAVPTATSFMVVCQALDQSGKVFVPGAKPIQLKWNFSHPQMGSSVVQVVDIGAGEISQAAAKFIFMGTPGLAGYYLADTGRYALSVVSSKDPSQQKNLVASSIAIKGEGCGMANSISFHLDVSRFRQVTGPQITLGTTPGSYYIQSGASFTTDGSSSFFFINSTAKVTDRGTKNTAIVFKTGSYTAEDVPSLIYGEKGATIVAPKESLAIFNSALSYCQ
ncbi:MAG: hypothetical protein NTX25_05890 [Proteobacteria bacterium]|nr:hypothetical protein [Pseudomonadota bacterium]